MSSNFLNSSPVDGLVNKIVPLVENEMQRALIFSVSNLKDNTFYNSRVANPTLLAVADATGGASKFVPCFEQRFLNFMVIIRDELIDLSGVSPSLAKDFQARLPEVLKSAMKA